jgi:hypothetical protein
MKNHRTINLVVLVVLAAALTTVSILAFAYAGSVAVTYPSAASSGTNGYYQSGIGGDWCGMMGGNWGPSSVQTPATVQYAVLPLVGFVALIGAALTGASGAVYYIAVPKIRKTAPLTRSTVDTSTQNVLPPQSVITPYASVYKTLTTEERKVLDIVVSHDGKYLQKYIRSEAGLSRLKTHRIVTRLVERGIVTLEKSGNTNEVHLSSWIQLKPGANPMSKGSKEPIEIKVRP